jgi:hypothetical protein
MDFTTNGVVITDTIKFLQNSKEKLNVSKGTRRKRHRRTIKYESGLLTNKGNGYFYVINYYQQE